MRSERSRRLGQLSRRTVLRLGVVGGLATVLGLPRQAVPSTGGGFTPVSAADTMPDPTSVPVSPITFDAVFVVNGGDGMTSSISVINANRNTLGGTIELMNAMWPHHVYLSADRSRLAVAVPGMDMSMGHDMPENPDMMGAVMLLDARTGATVNSMMLSHMNHNAVFSPNQREIWTSQMMDEGSVLVLDARTLETLREIPVGMMPAEVTFSPSGRSAWVADGGSDQVTVIDPSTKAVVKTIAVGDNPVGPWQASNGFVYVDNETAQTVSVIERSSLKVARTIDLGFMPGMVKLGPDNHLWVTDADNGQVVLFSVPAYARVRAIKTGDGAHGVTFSNSGRHAYVTNQMANTLSVIDVRSRTVEATIAVGTKPNGLVFRARS